MLDLTKSAPLKIIVGSPLGENLKPGYMISMMGLMGSLSPERVLLRPVPCMGSNIAENQNCIVDAGHETGADYILFVEADMAFPKHALAQLLSHEKEIVGCTYAYKDRDLLPKRMRGDAITYRIMGHEYGASEITLESLIRGEPLRRVDFVPMGLTLISMKAIRAVQEVIAEKTGAPDGKPGPAFFHNITYPLDRDRGIVSTTDSAFCATAREAGFDVWLDARLSLQLEHIGDCAYGLLPDAPKNSVHEMQEQIAETIKQ